MTCDLEDSAVADLLPLLMNGNDDRFRDALGLLLNAAMLLERQRHLRAEPFERTDARNGHANGFKEKRYKTRLGELNLAVPQVRGSNEPFYPKSLEKGLRSERALKIALAEMYVQGVSTRKVATITEKLCGFEVSSTQVSHAAAQLDEQIHEWRTRSLGEMPYLILDARYEKVRQGGIVRTAAVLVAVGIDKDGKRQIIGVSVALSEQEAQSLVERELSGVQLIVSDAHEGLAAARTAVFGAIPWQRCQCHLQRNAFSYIPKQEMKVKVASELRSIFTASDRQSAEVLLRAMVARYQSSAPKLADWLEANVPEGLTILSLPCERHRRLLRTTNSLERVNKEIKRRTRVATMFPNEASCLRLVSAVLMEISDEWISGKAYLTF
jgi:transposase-like protein